MSKTYRKINYGWRDVNPSTPETDCYGIANVKGEYWKWRKEVGKEAPEPWYFTKCLPKLKGVKLKHFNKRDKKPWYKPPGWYKQMREQQFRAQTKEAIFNELMTDDGNFPLSLKTDIYNWS